MASEGGLLVGVPAIVALALFVREVARRFREGEEDASTYWLRAGAVTGLIGAGLQETVDFSLQIPGITALFALLCAIALHGAEWRSGAGRKTVDEAWTSFAK